MTVSESGYRSRQLRRTMTAVGVARPTAQGQAMTRVAIPKLSAKMKWLLLLGIQSEGKLSVRPAGDVKRLSSSFGFETRVAVDAVQDTNACDCPDLLWHCLKTCKPKADK